jgi:hypothetical protein
MNKVYWHIALAPDEYLGWVDTDGTVYETRRGPDKKVGRVELESGKVYETRFGPDKYIGRVDLENGKVYISKLGPDEYLGQVHQDGNIYHHKRMAADHYLGKVIEMSSFAHGGGAFLLLIQTVYDEEQLMKQEDKQGKEKSEAPDAGSTETGQAGAPA